MKYAILPLFITAVFSCASGAFADYVGVRGETVCFPAEDVGKIVRELAKVKPERRKIVDVRLEPRFIIKDGGVWPDKFYLSKGGQMVTDLPFSRETGAVPDFIDEASARPDTDICIDDSTRAERPENDEGLYFEMGLAPLFKTAIGEHSLTDLEKATKDGKKFYKKMLPDFAAILMPNTNHFAIKMKDRSAQPTALVLNDLTETELMLESVDDMWVLSLDDIIETGAERLIVRGGAYDLQPVPSPKVLRKFVLKDASHAK